MKISQAVLWLIAFFCATPSVLAQTINGYEHWLSHDTVRLYVWEKVRGDAAGKPVLVIAHGSGTAGKESFDLQVPGRPSYSLMDFFAKQGFDVFAPDMRGFGRSAKPERHITTEEASSDLAAVIDYARNLRGVEKVNLLAWSWGTQYAGMVVMNRPEIIEKYIASAQMHANSPDLLRRKAQLDVYQKNVYLDVTEAGWKKRFASMTPPHISDSEVIDSFAHAAATAQPRIPTGPQIDMVTRMPMLDPTRMTVPMLIIHGEFDDVADLDGLLPFFRALPNPNKQYVVVPNGGHMMHLQLGHKRLQYELDRFLNAP